MSRARGSVAMSSTATGDPVSTTTPARERSNGSPRMASGSASTPDVARSISEERSWPVRIQATSAPATSRARSAIVCSSSTPESARRQECRDLRGRREPALPPRGLVVQPGVLDRDARRGGEGDHDLLVRDGEVVPADLLGEVEVAEHPVPDADRHAEERRHRRVVVGEAVRRGVLVDVVQSERLRVVDQQSEHAVPARQVADLGDQTLGHAVVDEGPQPAVGGQRRARRARRTGRPRARRRSPRCVAGRRRG